MQSSLCFETFTLECNLYKLFLYFCVVIQLKMQQIPYSQGYFHTSSLGIVLVSWSPPHVISVLHYTTILYHTQTEDGAVSSEVQWHEEVQSWDPVCLQLPICEHVNDNIWTDQELKYQSFLLLALICFHLSSSRGTKKFLRLSLVRQFLEKL